MPDLGAPSPLYLTVEQVAEMLQFSTKSVYRLAKDDPTMPVLRLGKGPNAMVRFPRERLEVWLRAHEQGRPRSQKQMRGADNHAPDKGATGAAAAVR